MYIFSIFVDFFLLILKGCAHFDLFLNKSKWAHPFKINLTKIFVQVTAMTFLNTKLRQNTIITETSIRTHILVYVPTCIHLFPHARTDTIQVVEHEPNFSKFYPLTISFLVSQFCTLESSLCVSSSDYCLIFPFGSSLILGSFKPQNSHFRMHSSDHCQYTEWTHDW